MSNETTDIVVPLASARKNVLLESAGNAITTASSLAIFNASIDVVQQQWERGFLSPLDSKSLKMSIAFGAVTGAILGAVCKAYQTIRYNKGLEQASEYTARLNNAKTTKPAAAAQDR